MKRDRGFPNIFINLFDYVMDGGNSESEGHKPAIITRSENAFLYFLFYRQKCEEQLETFQGQLPRRTQENEWK